MRPAASRSPRLARLALMLFLMVERARGSQSHVAPYMAALPATFASPLFYTAEELTLLRGTVRRLPKLEYKH